MNPTNGKTDKRLHDRTKLKHEEMQSNWDKAFPKKDKQTEVKKDGAENKKMPKNLHDDLGSMLIYAARYAHTRNTGAAMQVVNCAIKNWDRLKEEHRVQLAKETKDATCNFEDWDRLLNLFNGSWD